MNYSQLKEETKKVLRGNVLALFGAVLIVSLISSIGVFTKNPAFSLLVSLIASVLTAGLYLVVKGLFENGSVDYHKIFHFFKNLNHAGKLILLQLVISLIVFLGCVLLIIPGIIFALQYSQATYIMADNPELSIGDAMRKSKELMNGYKLNYFGFVLSFILHLLLAFVTLGIYLIYLLPYLEASMVNYYRHLTGQNIVISSVVPDEPVAE